MTMLHFGRSAIRSFHSVTRRFVGERRGVAAIEFAFIAPVLLSLYFVTMEVSQAIEVNKKVGRVASMVADLVTQRDELSKTELDAILKIGESLLQPYNRSAANITITAIQLNDDKTPKAHVVWSRKLENGSTSQAAAPGTTTTVPAKLKLPETFLVRVTSELAYKPVIAWAADQKQVLGLAAAFDGISMSETYYLRPRIQNVELDD